MGAAAGATAGVAGAGGILSAYENVEAGKGQSAYYSYLSSTANANAGLAEAEGTADNEQIGAQEAQAQVGLTNKINATIGAQKASMVNGVGASSRSAQTIISDTMMMGNVDEMALRYNSELASKNAILGSQVQALNYQTQGAGYNIAGANARAMGTLQGVGSLMGAAGSVANSWYLGTLYGGRMGGAAYSPAPGTTMGPWNPGTVSGEGW